jgi:LPXTG-site transpeptidase (sortase) family protein
MLTSGLIYDSSFSQPWGTVWVDVEKGGVNSKQTIVNSNKLPITNYRLPFTNCLKLFSNFLVLGSLAGMILTMLPVAAMEIKYQLDVNRESLIVNRDQSAVSDSRLAVNESPAGPANDLEAFGVHINKINAHSVVVPNVDANDPKIYMEALKNGVAHALGSGLPGVESSINRSIYLFAHSTSAPSLVSQYNAQFYLLHKLETGDEIEIVFWNKNYKYRVTDKKTVAADDTSFLQPQTDKEILILATCTPPGTTWKRLIIVAERI